MLVTVSRPNFSAAPVKVSGPGPVESHLEKKKPARSDTLVETGNLLGEDNEPSLIEDEDEGEEEALDPHVKPEQVSQDPYAGLDGAFGNYGDKTDGPQSAAPKVSLEGELQQTQQRQQQPLPGSEPTNPRKDAEFGQSVAALNQISQLGS